MSFIFSFIFKMSLISVILAGNDFEYKFKAPSALLQKFSISEEENCLNLYLTKNSKLVPNEVREIVHQMNITNHFIRSINNTNIIHKKLHSCQNKKFDEEIKIPHFHLQFTDKFERENLEVFLQTYQNSFPNHMSNQEKNLILEQWNNYAKEDGVCFWDQT